MIRSWFRAMVRTWSSGHPFRTPPPGRRPRIVLRLEAVEDRTVASATSHEPAVVLTGPAQVATPDPKSGDNQSQSTDGPTAHSPHAALLGDAAPVDAALEATTAAIPVFSNRAAGFDTTVADENSATTDSTAQPTSSGTTQPTASAAADVDGVTIAGPTATPAPPASVVPATSGSVAASKFARGPAAAPVVHSSAPATAAAVNVPAAANSPLPIEFGPAIQRTAAPPATAGPLPANLSDGALIQRFVANRDQTAFAALVQRYGGMVLGVSQKVLGDFHAAQDASQATFMVLARKAGMLDRTTPLGGWLYRVAYHLALRSRAVAARQRLGEKAAADEQPTATTDHGPATIEQQEIHQVLREELERLPEKYREPLTLCYVDGRSHAEAAREIGLPRGSMAKRVGEGLERLRERLVSRGFAL